jgi:23S rRNA (guanosine2251-2'-O)-methyltransferase
MKQDKIYIYGKNALIEALNNRPDVIGKVFLTKKLQSDQVLSKLLNKHKINVSLLNENETKNKVGNDAKHQGVIATLLVDKLYSSLEDVLKMDKKDVGGNPSIVVLGELEDPHNVGAIIRSSAGFGVQAVLLPEHNQAHITGSVVKTSAGMVFRIPIVKIGNVNDTLKKLKERGYWVYGLDMVGQNLSETTFDTPCVFVVGNEGFGLREKTQEACDILLSIDIDKRCESLNAAVATSVVLYEWSKGRNLK